MFPNIKLNCNQLTMFSIQDVHPWVGWLNTCRACKGSWGKYYRHGLKHSTIHMPILLKIWHLLRKCKLQRHKAQSHISICFFRVMQATNFELMKISGRLIWFSSSTKQRNSVLNVFDSYCRQSKNYLVIPHVTCSIFSTSFLMHTNPRSAGCKES
jgi:hypothetical protein